MSNEAPTALILGGTGRTGSFLSTYNADQAPEGIDIAAVEASLAARQAVTHSVLRHAWVMQNFTERNARAWTVETR